jgi:hypothetical protein
MRTRVVTALAALLLACPAASATAPLPLLDRTSVEPAEGPPRGRGDRALFVHASPPRLGGRALRLPVAWSARGDAALVDEGLSAELSLALLGLSVDARIGSRLASRALEAAEPLALLDPLEAGELLVHEPRGSGAPPLRIAAVRVLTRGNVRDRWAVRPELVDPPEPPETEEGSPAPMPELPELPDLPAGRLLHVELVSLGLHVESDDASLPPLLAHLGVRARLWNLRDGMREWDRALVIGLPLDATAPRGAAFSSAVERLAESAADRLAADLWPELQLVIDDPASASPAPPAPAPEAVATAEPEAEAAVPEGAEALLAHGAARGPRPGGGVRELLRELAESRLSEPPDGEPWAALARAVRPDLPEALALALSCAEDPLGAAVETGASRLGLGLAETYRRVERSSAFRRALAQDLVAQASAAAGDDWQLERAVRYLLAELADAPAPAADAPRVAEPLLLRARADGARSPEGVAALLVAVQVWPEGGRATLSELLRR